MVIYRTAKHIQSSAQDDDVDEDDDDDDDDDDSDDICHDGTHYDDTNPQDCKTWINYPFKSAAQDNCQPGTEWNSGAANKCNFYNDCKAI